MECTASLRRAEPDDAVQGQVGEAQGDFVSAGLFTYPALQAADILLYDAEEVPVGEDQRQHIEITRDLALRFNHPLRRDVRHSQGRDPKAGARVMDLQDPTSKMSKTGDTEAGCIMLMDDPGDIARKFKRAVTDSDNEVRYDRATKPGVSNLLEILAVSTGTPPQELAGKYTQYGPLKTDAGDAVIELLRPIQTRYKELMTDRGELAALLRKGSHKAGVVAAATVERGTTARSAFRRADEYQSRRRLSRPPHGTSHRESDSPGQLICSCQLHGIWRRCSKLAGWRAESPDQGGAAFRISEMTGVPARRVATAVIVAETMYTSRTAHLASDHAVVTRRTRGRSGP